MVSPQMIADTVSESSRPSYKTFNSNYSWEVALKCIKRSDPTYYTRGQLSSQRQSMPCLSIVKTILP